MNRGAPSRPEQLDRGEVRLLEVEAVGGHQPDAGLRRRADHGAAVAPGDRQRLLAEHVDAGVRGPLGVLPVKIVR